MEKIANERKMVKANEEYYSKMVAGCFYVVKNQQRNMKQKRYAVKKFKTKQETHLTRQNETNMIHMKSKRQKETPWLKEEIKCAVASSG